MDANYLNMKFLPLPRTSGFLPLPRDKEKAKWDYLDERLRRKKERYLEGLKIYKTIKEAMTYAGIKSRQTIVNYREADQEFVKQEFDILEGNDADMIELAEKQLFLLIQNGEGWAIKYLLDRRSDKYKPKGEIDIKKFSEIEEQRTDLNNLIENVKTSLTKIGPGS